ncbi:hypothetical protein PRZ61_08255 [Halomonas pacifica]|uniref:hypothetical protein n=1 Tax=Bisbaumannia pacifica TaxID=77098 RepID=UPI002358FE00|nr:hypothetical protein [Halomonas pacifica]MDC8803433.1 hypothetical protein [Halomonas pacifica]
MVSADQAQGLRRWVESQGRGDEDSEGPRAMDSVESQGRSDEDNEGPRAMDSVESQAEHQGRGDEDNEAPQAMEGVESQAESQGRDGEEGPAPDVMDGDGGEDRETLIARTLREIALAAPAEASTPRPATPGEGATPSPAPGASPEDRETAIARVLVEIARAEPRAAAQPPPAKPTSERTSPSAKPPTPPKARPNVAKAAAPRAAAEPAARHRLRVLGLAEEERPRAQRLLAAWAERGQRWVGDPRAWRLAAVPAEALGRYPAQGRWALWVAPGPDAFRRGYRLLLALSRRPGPRRLLLLMPGMRSRRGLPDNLVQVAADLGIDLLVITP